MAIEFKPSTERIQAGSQQYNVQPNQSLARAFQATEQALLGGMKLREQINEEQFRKDQSDMQNAMSAFNEDYAKASWAQKQTMAGELEAMFVAPHNEDNRWSRALKTAGTDFKSRVSQALEQEREQRARAAAAAAKAAADRAARNAQNLAAIELRQQLQDTPNVEEQATLLAQWKTDNVDPYQGVDDEAYIRGLDLYTNTRGYIVENRRIITDNRIKDDVLVATQAQLAVDGGLTPEFLADTRAQLTELSDYEQNSASYNQAFANQTVSLLYSHYNSLPATQDNVNLLKAQVADLTKFDPRIMNSEGYRTLQNVAASMQNTVNVEERSAVSAMLQDGGVSQAVFDKRVDAAVALDLYNEEEANALKYQKAGNVEVAAQREVIAPMIMSENWAGLAAGVQDGSLNGGTVSSTLANVWETQQAALLAENPNNAAQINTYMLSQYAEASKAGIAPAKLGFVDNALKLTKSGELLTPEQSSEFMATYEAAREAGYHGAIDATVTADYLALRTMASLGIPNREEALYNSKVSPVRVTDKETDTALNRAINANPTWSENLNPYSTTFLRTALRPMVKMLQRSGLDAGDVEDLVKEGIESQYFRADPVFGGGSEVWIPRTPDIQNEDSYNRVYDGLKAEFKASGGDLSFVGPMRFNEPLGSWIAIDKDGNQLSIPYEDIAVVARTGRLP